MFILINMISRKGSTPQYNNLYLELAIRYDCDIKSAMYGTIVVTYLFAIVMIPIFKLSYYIRTSRGAPFWSLMY